MDKNLDQLEKIANAYKKFPNDFPNRLDQYTQESYEFMRDYTTYIMKKVKRPIDKFMSGKD